MPKCLRCHRTIEPLDRMVLVLTVVPALFWKTVDAQFDVTPGRWHWSCAPNPVRQYAPPVLVDSDDDPDREAPPNPEVEADELPEQQPKRRHRGRRGTGAAVFVALAGAVCLALLNAPTVAAQHVNDLLRLNEAFAALGF